MADWGNPVRLFIMILNYPFKTKGGQIVLTEGILELKQKILYFLRTRRFTRVMNQDFGIPDPNFNSSTYIAEIEIDISQQLRKYFPEISEVRVSVDSIDHDSGKFTLTLFVKLRAGETVPPFQLEAS